MPVELFYQLAADTILVFHALIVAFVVLGLVVIYLGRWLSWVWVLNFWFRLLHLTAMVIVALQSWLGAICPLTIWEMRLRERAGTEIYDGSFIQHWVQRILYYEAPGWVFIAGYTLFAVLIIASWFIVPPRRHK